MRWKIALMASLLGGSIHENELEPGPDGNVGYDNTCLIAESFDQFMNSLYEKKD